MEMTSLVTRLRGWKAEAEEMLRPCSSGPSEGIAASWYAGMAVSPASFSRQLTEMESALVRANEPAESELVETKIGFR